MPKNKVVCTGLPDLAFFGHEFHIIGIFGNFLSEICHFSKITLYFATDSDPDRTEFCFFGFLTTVLMQAAVFLSYKSLRPLYHPLLGIIHDI